MRDREPRPVGLPTGRLTFLFSDVEGSTRHLTRLGDRFATAHGLHQRIVRDALARHDGLEVSTEGDSFFAVFHEATAAVEAAAEAHGRLAAQGWPDGHPFRVRIGLHTGQAVLAGGDYVGIDINRAARIANAAHGGQTVLSDETRGAFNGQLPDGLSLTDLGRHRLKDVGVLRLWQLDLPSDDNHFGPLRSLEAHPSNLPAEVTSFVDRVAEVAELTELVLVARLVTLTGPGGIGKSRLAIRVGHELVERFPDGAFYLDLAPHERIETVVSELAGLLGIRASPDEDPAEVLADHLRHRSALLVIDTVDRLDAFPALAQRLTSASGELRMLVTARAPLHLSAEREYPLRTLGLPTGPRPSPGAVAESPSVQLFIRRAQSIRPGFELTESNSLALAAIVARLDGLPLAIELAAARIRLFPPETILARLTNRLPLLAGGPVDTPIRQRTMRATIAWSYELLEGDEQRALQILSVFAGEFDLAAAEALMAGDAGGSGADAADLIERLVDRSLVIAGDSDDEPTFRLLGTIREFATDALEATGDGDVVRERHARYWHDVASRQNAMLDSPDELAALGRLNGADDDFRAALEWALGDGDAAPLQRARDDHLALAITCALGRSWYLRGRVVEGSDLIERALAADPEGPAAIRAAALHWSGVLFDERRDEARAMERLDAALTIQRSMGDSRLIARELNSLGVVARNAGDIDRAGELLEESLAIRRRLDDRQGIATTLTNLGIIAIDRDELDNARKLLEEAAALDRESGALGALAYSSSLVGTVQVRTGELEDGIAKLQTALRIFGQLGDPDGVAECLERLAESTLERSPAIAARLLFAASTIRLREGVPRRPIDDAPANRLVSSLEAALDSSVLHDAEHEAAAMDLDAAVAFALSST